MPRDYRAKIVKKMQFSPDNNFKSGENRKKNANFAR